MMVTHSIIDPTSWGGHGSAYPLSKYLFRMFKGQMTLQQSFNDEMGPERVAVHCRTVALCGLSALRLPIGLYLGPATCLDGGSS